MTCYKCGVETKNARIVLVPSAEGYPRLRNLFFCEVCWRKRHNKPWRWFRVLQILRLY